MAESLPACPIYSARSRHYRISIYSKSLAPLWKAQGFHPPFRRVVSKGVPQRAPETRGFARHEPIRYQEQENHEPISSHLSST